MISLVEKKMGLELVQRRRCSGRRHDGRRCRRRIAFCVKTCFEHDKNFRIKKSTIPGAGRGLFAKNGLLVGDVIDTYKGEFKTPEEYNNGLSVYGMWNRGLVIDAYRTQSCISRLINDGRDERENNCRFVSYMGNVYVVVIRNIRAGEELLASYGPLYWD